MVKILIAVPTYENIMPDTFKSIYDLDKCGHECIFEFIRGYDCALARNRIAERALDLAVDFVLMVDNDVILPSDALKNLLEESMDICLGYYAHRIGENIYDGRVCLCKNDGEFNYTHLFSGKELSAIKGAGIKKIQIHGGGMGCALFKTNVFEKLPYPWFKFVTYDDGDVLGEDLYFCELCKQYDIPVFADARVGCKHLFRSFIVPE